MPQSLSKPIKILAVIPGEASGSSMVFARRQMEALQQRGAAVAYFFLASRTHPVALWKEIKRYRALIRSFNPDLVHAHYGTVTAFVSAYFTRKPVVITFQGSDLNYTPKDGLLRDFFGRMLSQLANLRAAGTICVSPALRDLLWRTRKAQVMPVGIDLDVFAPLPRQDARAALGWEPDGKVILFNANNPVIKRLDLAEEALRILQNKIPGCRLEVMRGQTDPNQVPLMLNACDAVLLCSDREGSPVIIKEAMACNTPICAVAVGDVAERIGQMQGARLVAQDPQALATGLFQLLTETVSCNGREMLQQQHLDQHSIIQQLLQLYQSILSH